MSVLPYCHSAIKATLETCAPSKPTPVYPCILQESLEATSIELATRLLSMMVDSLSSLVTVLMATQQHHYTDHHHSQQRQLPQWAPALHHALAEVQHCTLDGRSPCTDRCVLLSVLPLLEAGNALEQSRCDMR
jgi:hypothetical protein